MPVFALPPFTVSDVRLKAPPEGLQGVKSKLETIGHDGTAHDVTEPTLRAGSSWPPW